ncbi:hypothetical protein [Agrobacterium tumefaciens]|uniref:hypothetical protein n=1 Tax=Agrobacterium tumefaciens TaxID=358 RepID=UPI0015717132|nr:hypothetical protein [Agrobacterium tumefaciens]NTB05943.1 hypothetical protein [Agrobacterium tumefaciens]
MHQATLPEGATARLTMLGGSPCSIAEFVLYAEQCEYHEDPNRGTRFVMAGTAQGVAPCAIELDHLSGTVEALTVYGQEMDHFSNLNYLMQKAGWTACSVTTVNDDLNARLLARLVNVEVSDSSSVASLPASTALAPAAVVHPFPAPHGEAREESPTAPQAAGAQEDLVDAVETHQHTNELLIERNALDERCEMLLAENTELRSTVETLKAELSAATTALQSRGAVETSAASLHPSSPALLQIIDKYLLSRMQIGERLATEVVDDLRAAGFDVRLSIVPVSHP